MPRIAHLADLHLDQTPHAPDAVTRRRMLRENIALLDHAVEQVLGRDVDLAVISGDLFAHGNPSAETVLQACQSLKPLLDEGVELALEPGNHEYLRYSPGNRTSVRLVRQVLSRYGTVRVADGKPKLLHMPSGIQVAALPWIDAGGLMRSHGLPGMDDEAANALVANLLADMLTDVMEAADDSAPLISMAHLTVSSAQRGAERDLTALYREPVVSAADLAQTPAAYHALGHLHTPQDLADNVRYCGSLQRLTFTDEPDDKGWSLVEVSDDNRLVSVEHVSVPARTLLTIGTSTDVDIPDHALVRVRLDPGMDRTPDDLRALIAAAGARLVSEKAAPVTQVRATLDPERALPEKVTRTDALRRYVATHHPEADLARVVAMAQELEAMAG